jgi:hypothetical protein
MTDTLTVRHSARIASLVPGRIRLKLHDAGRGRAVLDRIKQELESREGVHDVKVNGTSGSFTVRYDETRHGAAGILGWLEDLDVLVESVGHFPSVDPGNAPVGGFLAAIEDLNQRIHRATGLPVDVKLVLPLTFAGAGVWSILRRGLMIEAVPGWLFLWFAFDTFVKLHPNRTDPSPPSR